ncbi:glycosyltransferase [Candidatus Sumerlaeota bacterium]|nr:glycosyltransferase [Candidatus Sumerlaeota bacterium]
MRRGNGVRSDEKQRCPCPIVRNNTQPMRRLLIISYDFPPSSIGIWRTLKFCHYMTEFGWQPYILTVKPAPSSRWDEGPLKELPRGTEIRRTEALERARVAHLLRKAKATLIGGSKREPGRSNQPPAQNANSILRGAMEFLRRWAFIPDERIGWLPFAYAKACTWMREEKFDAVYTTSFPATAHVIGAMLASKFRVPLLSDFRDIWIGNYVFYHPATRFHDRLHRRLERFVVNESACVVSATRQITDDFLQRYLDAPVEKFSTITNGFDDRDFIFPDVVPGKDVFTIAYVGTMYGATSPRWFFEAVSEVMRADPAWREKMRIRFVGSMVEPYRSMIQEHALGDIVTVEDYVAHDKALQIMAEADVLLLIVADVPGSHVMLTQKVFEYAAARRPILGLVPDGAARDFLVELNEGEIAPPDNAPAIATALKKLLKAWDEGGRVTLPENPIIGKYHRRVLTQQLCAELDRIVRKPSRSRRPA